MTDKQILALSFVIFIGIGLLGSSLGPALPDLAEQTGSTLAALGAIFTASFGGTMIAQVSAGPLNDRLGQRPVLLAGIMLGVMGALGILLSHALWLTLAASAIFGMGFGALDVSLNILIAEVFAARSVPVLNLLHVFFGVGSVAGPAIASGTLKLWDTALPPIGVGVVMVMLTIPAILRLAPGPLRAKDDTPNAAAEKFSYRVPLLWALGALLMLYVGIESGIGAWTTAYADRSTTLSKETAALLTSGYWFALTVGRVAGAIWGGRFQPYFVLGASLAGMMAGGVLLALGTGNIAMTILAVLVLGLWSGPPYPTVVAITTRAFRSGPGKATGAVVSLGSLGAATLPWSQGIVLDQIGTAAYAIFIAGLTAVMMLMFIGIRRRSATVSVHRVVPDRV
jgi:FHS family glucose/mannose:H+ symporter-like MFS transporter